MHGIVESQFLRIYQDNISIQIDEAIQANPLSMTVVELINTTNKMDKTPTELYLELSEILLKLN